MQRVTPHCPTSTTLPVLSAHPPTAASGNHHHHHHLACLHSLRNGKRPFSCAEARTGWSTAISAVSMSTYHSLRDRQVGLYSQSRLRWEPLLTLDSLHRAHSEPQPCPRPFRLDARQHRFQWTGHQVDAYPECRRRAHMESASLRRPGKGCHQQCTAGERSAELGSYNTPVRWALSTVV